MKITRFRGIIDGICIYVTVSLNNMSAHCLMMLFSESFGCEVGDYIDLIASLLR